jgi:hypothetical protein
VRVAAPVIRFGAPPPLVTVEPGVQVVRDADEEVFYVRGWYWHPGPDGWWYRTHDCHGGWVAVPPQAVPGRLVEMPRGRYRHWRGEERAREREERSAERDRERQEHWAERDHERQERRVEHQERKLEKRREREERANERWTRKHEGRRAARD